MNKWMGRGTDPCRDLEGALSVSLRLDEDGNAEVRPVATSRAAAKEAMRRLKLWVDEKSWFAEALDEQGIELLRDVLKKHDGRAGEPNCPGDGFGPEVRDLMQVMIRLAHDGSGVVSTHPESVVETKRRLRIWADHATDEPEIEITREELGHLAAWETIADWYPGKYDSVETD